MPLADLASIPIVVPAPPVPSLAAYHPTWGYFTFGQRVETAYNDGSVYRSRAIFTITGVFTANSEGFSGDFDRTASMTALMAKYEALRAIMENAAATAPPDDPLLWYTPDDHRFITLPDPIRDMHGARIVARPLNLSIEPGLYTEEVRYTATLEEAEVPQCLLKVGPVTLVDARLSIEPPKPITHRHRAIGGEGDAIYIENYTATRLRVSGIIPLVGEQISNEQVRRMGDALQGATIDIFSVVTRGPTAGERVMFRSVRVLSPSIDFRMVERGAAVSFEGVL